MSCLATQELGLPAGATTRLEEGVRVERLSQRAAGRSAKDLLLRHGWKIGFAVLALALLTTRGVEQVQTNGRALDNTILPTNVPCGTIATDSASSNTATWTATTSPYGSGSPYHLPINFANNLDQTVTPCTGGVIVPQGVTLKIDATNGPVKIFSHGAGIIVQGGHLLVIGTQPTGTTVNAVSFDAEPDVASWDGISIHAADASHLGDGSFTYASIEHALTAITIDSGATSFVGSGSYGLTLSNTGIVNSYFDGIDATNTPISLSGMRDGRFGTLNNIGSFGIKVAFDKNAPPPPENALKVDGMTFGSSVPFAEPTTCPPLSACAAGTIGNDAIHGTFAQGLTQRASITSSDFFRAGNFGIDLANANDPIVAGNTFDCNGTGSPDPKHTCASTVATKSSPIYLNNATADLDANVKNNSGKEDGLEAIVFNGSITAQKTFTWKTAGADPNELGYVLNGDLNMIGGTFVVPRSAIVKVKGTLNLNGTKLDASDPGRAPQLGNPAQPADKIFTSLRDNSVGVAAGCSVFVQVCTPPLPLPPGDWGGINLLNGADATLFDASIQYATTGVQIVNGKTATTGSPSFGLVVERGPIYPMSTQLGTSQIGPTFADGIDALDTPISVSDTAFICPTTTCANPSPIRNHGIVADFTGAGPLGQGLKLNGNTINGTGNEAILGTALSRRDPTTGQVQDSQTVSVTGNTISNAGAYGIKLEKAVNPTLTGNTVTASGVGSPSYSAVYLPDVANADLVNSVTNNTGSGNGLDGIAIHGTTSGDFRWRTIGASLALGYLVDGNLTINGKFILNPADYVPVLGGAITVKGNPMIADGAVISSLREQVLYIPSCGSVFVPKRTDGTCQSKAPGDWNGIVLTSGQANVVMNSEIRYATTGITVGAPNTATTSLTLTNTNVRNSSGDGVSTGSTLAISKGAFTKLGGHGIVADLTGDGGTATASIDQAIVGGAGAEGILIIGDAGHVAVTNTVVDQAGAFGIHLKSTINPAVSTNRVTNTAPGYPAIYLDGIDQADFTTASGIQGNSGGLNPVNALAMHGNIKGGLGWITARMTADPTNPLGFILDGDLNLTDSTLTLKAGDIVKISNGRLTLAGGRLDASDTSSSSQKVFTSLQDTTIGVPCPASLSSVNCSGAGAPGQWNGIDLTANVTKADGTLVNTAIRNATTGIFIDSQATSTVASSVYGLVVSRSSVMSGTIDGIGDSATAISVTDSTINGMNGLQGHGINVDLTGSAAGTPVRLSGNRLTSTSAEAILGQALAGRPVWISDNHVIRSNSFGIRLVNADQLVLRNNNVSGSGKVSPYYPAVYLKNVSADFSRNVRGNVGTGNQFNAIAFDGAVQGNLDWITPDGAATAPLLGYLLDSGVTINGGNLTIRSGSVVKALGGPITISGGTLNAAADTGAKTFTSLKDTMAPLTCPSFFGPCGAGKGDWGGIVITQNGAARGSGSFDSATISYAETGIFIDSGPIVSGEKDASNNPLNARLTVLDGTTIKQASKDGINTLDTPISVKGSYVGDPAATSRDIDGRGIIASFFSPANCPAPPAACRRLEVDNTHVTWAGKDGIIANGLNGQPVVVTGNNVQHSGTYGIRLVGSDNLTLTGNDASNNGAGNPNLLYPAVYLNGITGDFSPTGGITANTGSGNGLDAMVFHGTANNGLTWITPGNAGTTLGYMLDGALTVNGAFTSTAVYDSSHVLLSPGVVKVLTGGIKVNGAVTSTDTLFTSMKEDVAPLACNTVFVTTACPTPVQPADYWGGINIDADASSLTNGAIRYSTSGVSISGAPLTVTGATIEHIRPGSAFTLTAAGGTFRRDVFSDTGTALSHTGTGTLLVDCSDIQGNSTGVSALAGDSVTHSDVFNNGTDLNGGLTADNVWLGGGGGTTSGVTFAHTPLVYRNPSLDADGGSIALTDSNTNSVNSQFGTGTLAGKFIFSRPMDGNPAEPLVTFTPDNNALTGAWVRDPLATNPVITEWDGTFALSHSGLTPTTDSAKNVQVVGARSCIPEYPVGSGSNLMRQPQTTAGLNALSFTTNLTQLPVATNLAATHPGATSAILNGTVDPLGWSTNAHFEWTDSLSVVHQVALTNPSVGNGSGVVPISALATGLQSKPVQTPFRVVAANGNGIATASPDLLVSTTGPATAFLITDPPASTVAGTGVPQTVSAIDASGDIVGDYAGSVHLTSSDLQATFRLAGTQDPPILLPADVTFGGGDYGSQNYTVFFKTAGSQTLAATDIHGLTGTGAAVPITPAPLSQILVSGLSDGVAGVPQSPTLTAADAFSNVINGYVGTVHFSSTDSQAVLPSDYTFLPTDNGAHTFTNLLTLRTAGSKTVTATDTVTNSLTGSQTITIRPNNAASLELTGLSGSTAGASQTATITAKDPYGNTATGYTGTTHFSSSDSQAVVPGDYTFVAVDGGSHTFSNGVTLKTAGPQSVAVGDTGAPLLAATESGLVVTPASESRLAFGTQPSNLVAGSAITPTVTVAIQDAFGNTTPSTASVTVAIGANPAGATLSGTASANAVNGVASFANLSLNKAATGYTLAASSTGVTGATSSAFNVSAGAPSQLSFATQPTNVVAGSAIAPAVTVAIQDAFGNTTTSTASVTVAIGTNPGSATLSGTASANAVNGVASFANLSLNKAATGYTLTASSAGPINATSNSFDVAAAAPSQLVIMTQPSNVAAGAAITPAVTVAIQDAFGNATTSTASVTIALGANPGGATLSGTTTVAAVNGLATFGDLTLDKAGIGYTLAASSGSLAGATSSTFNVT